MRLLIQIDSPAYPLFECLSNQTHTGSEQHTPVIPCSSLTLTYNLHSTVSPGFSRMVLRTSLDRALPSERKPNTSSSAPCLAGLFGCRKQPQSARITALREALSIPVSDATLADVLSSLPSGLRRRRNSRSTDLCSMHAILCKGPLIKITKLLTYELHARLAHLYQFPPAYLSLETRTHLYETLKPYRTYFCEEPSADADRKDDSESSIGATCLACTLSLFFQDEAAVKALAVCAKSRRHPGVEWPLLLDWLEPGKRKKGWEERWRLDAEIVRRDRRKAQVWRRCCRKEEREQRCVSVRAR